MYGCLMSRTEFAQFHCPVAQAAAVLSDPWTVLILREAFSGTSRFTDFERYLDIPKNTLTERLEHLVENEVMEKEPLPPRGRRFAYQLTPRGRDLLTVLTAMRDWSNRWVYGPGKEPFVVVDRTSGKQLPPVRLRDSKGALVTPSDLMAKPGPGADKAIRDRFGSSR